MTSPTPINREKTFNADEIIVSKTDLKGRITYGNERFIELAGYSEKELLDAPHNLIRHPDMPRTIFALLWDTIKGGEEINAYVKNLSKDGSFYWVFANVTPSYENGKIIGYHSVRRKPDSKILSQVITPLYKTLLGKEATGGIEEGRRYLTEVLTSKGVSYEEFILSI